MTSKMQLESADLLNDFAKSSRSGRRHAIPELTIDGTIATKLLSDKLATMSVDEPSKAKDKSNEDKSKAS